VTGGFAQDAQHKTKTLGLESMFWSDAESKSSTKKPQINRKEKSTAIKQGK